MARRDLHWKLAMTGLLAFSVGGCSGMADTFKSDAGWFSKPFSSVLSREDGSGNMGNKNFALGPTGPVGPEELVNADGSCAPPAPENAAPASPAAPASAQADRPVGSMAGDLAGEPMSASSAAAGSAPVLGGIALGMTECQAVRRAGTPSNVAIGTGDNNVRKVVLTYLSGTWPGVYTFESGRLKVIDEVPQAQKPAKKKPVAKKKRAPAKRG
ncbi:MAG: hypothetical protein JSR61_08980 [Proteobacteria bacterium]|nr:hypothetical protein [Pseudomonadota bacterium]